MGKSFYMAKWKWSLVILVISTGVIASCTKQNEETLKAKTGPVVCDTVGMRYSANVLPILQSNCYRCHAGGIVNGGVSLDGYNNVTTQVTNGHLIAAIKHAPGFVPMPFDGGKLSDCDIATIQAWINEGAPDN